MWLNGQNWTAKVREKLTIISPINLIVTIERIPATCHLLRKYSYLLILLVHTLIIARDRLIPICSMKSTLLSIIYRINSTSLYKVCEFMSYITVHNLSLCLAMVQKGEMLYRALLPPIWRSFKLSLDWSLALCIFKMAQL